MIAPNRRELIEKWRRIFRASQADAVLAIGDLGESDDPQKDVVSGVMTAYQLSNSQARLFVELGLMRLEKERKGK